MVKFRKGVLILQDFDNNEEATSAHWRITSEEMLTEPYRGIDFTAHCEEGRGMTFDLETYRLSPRCVV